MSLIGDVLRGSLFGVNCPFRINGWSVVLLEVYSFGCYIPWQVGTYWQR
jgi:hypothetical protein